MLMQLQADDSAQSLVDNVGGQQRDRACDRSGFAQTPQPAGDRRGRERNDFGQLLRSAVGILLHRIEEFEVETVEHLTNLARFWHRRQPNCLPSAAKMTYMGTIGTRP